MEKYNLEFKREITVTFLKTVSAFANYNDGEVVFGVDDTGRPVGMQDLEEESLRIENMINSSLEPLPDYQITREETEGKTLIRLLVFKGKDTPYYYKGKAYKRADTSTVEVDRFELRRLALEGLNLNYEEKKAGTQKLSFDLLEKKLKEKVGIEKLNLDIMKTLNLYDQQGYYNYAAELFSDKNFLEFSGLDLVRFGDSISQILYRERINKKSLLFQYDRAIELFEQYYTYEEIEGFLRQRKELIPKEAFREALANAIVHRVWDVNALIQIAMYEDRLEITSPGGLPAGMKQDEYLFGNISILRNPIVASVFHRLDIIEKFGTGISRINKEYKDSVTKPVFKIRENSVLIVLPVLNTDRGSLQPEEKTVLKALSLGQTLSRADLESKTGFEKHKLLRLVKDLEEKGLLEKVGKGPSTKYKRM
ncbi:MAG: AAA family ATPase [Clostridiales bacterium]|jgi:ATP-dependent DNA helicase RecG|nr:AAA family ATPase [Clostridiales bacterium]